MHEESGDIIVPHTADGVKVVREIVEDGIPMLVLETAEPEKFSETILEAIGIELEFSPELQELLAAPQTVTEMADDEQALRALIEASSLS